MKINFGYPSMDRYSKFRLVSILFLTLAEPCFHTQHYTAETYETTGYTQEPQADGPQHRTVHQPPHVQVMDSTEKPLVHYLVLVQVADVSVTRINVI